MKKSLLLGLVAFLCVAAAHAGVVAVGVDMVNTTYTASTELLLIEGYGLVATVTYDDGSPQGSINPVSFSLNSQLDSGMQFSGGTFAFINEGDLSVILSGNILSLDFTAAGGMLLGNGLAEVVYSNLSGYPEGPSEIVSLTFALNPAFKGFDQDYAGMSKVNFLVPEPATLALLSMGGLALMRRKRA